MADKQKTDKDEVVGCMLCGTELQILDKKYETSCDFCGKKSQISVRCENGHTICDICMDISPYEFVKRKCIDYRRTNPIELAVEIMNSPVISMHGPVHHFITPAVLTTCVNNKNGRKEDISEKLNIIEQRAQKETPDNCNFVKGNCGAANGTGVFLSMYLGRDAKDEDEWSDYNVIQAEALKRIENHGGPRCCKRDTYFSLAAASDFLRDKHAIDLPTSRAKCTFSLRNKTCGQEQCEFFNLSNSLV